MLAAVSEPNPPEETSGSPDPIAPREEGTKRAERKTAALLEVARAIAGRLDMDELLDRVQHVIAEVASCDRVAVFLQDPVSTESTLRSHRGLEGEHLEHARRLIFRPGDLPGHPIRDNDTVVLNDLRDRDDVYGRLGNMFGLAAMVLLPVRVPERVLGVLALGRTSPQQAFTDEVVEVCQGIGHQLAVAIEAASLYKIQQDEARIAAALARAGRELIGALEEAVLLERLGRLTTELLECDSCVTFVCETEKDGWVPAFAYPPREEMAETARCLLLPTTVFAGVVAALRERDVLQVRPIESSSPLAASLAGRIGMERILYVPIRRGDRIVALHAACRRSDAAPFSRLHERIAQGLGQLASFAVENARLVGELERASRLKSDFVATMSHELRTPLNIILGYSELMLDGGFGALSSKQSDAGSRIQKSAQQLLELVNETLDLGRLESGGLPLEIESVDVHAFLRSVEDEMDGLQRKQRLSVEWHVAAALPPLRTDAKKLKLILKNLVGNALKFTDEGSVVVGANALGEGVCFAVTDTGPGIAAADRAVIFDAFRQGDSSNTRKHGGVGLGLYIVRRLVQALGGSIDLESEVGKGSCFRVFIPSRHPDPPQAC